MGFTELNMHVFFHDHRVQKWFQSNLPVKRDMLLAFQKEHLQGKSHFHNCLHLGALVLGWGVHKRLIIHKLSPLSINLWMKYWFFCHCSSFIIFIRTFVYGMNLHSSEEASIKLTFELNIIVVFLKREVFFYWFSSSLSFKKIIFCYRNLFQKSEKWKDVSHF